MSRSKEGWLKVKFQNQSKWHRRYCIIDWDKAVLFTASKVDTRYQDWIQLLPNVIINDAEYSLNSESSHHLLSNSIEIIADNGKKAHYLQAETKEDCECWMIALKQTAYSRQGGGIFGQSLEDTYKYSQDKSSLVPLIVRQCCEHLLEYGVSFVGLFRVPGKQSSIKELRDMYDRGLTVKLSSSHSPATVSSLLKTYLQSLPEPIIPAKYFDDFLELGSRFKYNQTHDLNRLKQLIETSLSTIHHSVLAYLCIFLKKLTDFAQTTKMDTDNLAVVFGNNLIRPSETIDLNMVKGHSYNLLPLIKVFIDHSDYLFSNNCMNSLNDSYEQTLESTTKSSGFSSFESLLSSNDHMVATRTRSTSMPSLPKEKFSIFDSANINFEVQLEVDDIKRRQKSSFGKPNTLISSSQHSSEMNHGLSDLMTNEVSLGHKPLITQKRYQAIDSVGINNSIQESMKHNTRSFNDILNQHEQTFDHTYPPRSSMNAPKPISKMERFPVKASFANRFGKSISNIKSSMSKALQSQASPNENESQIIHSSVLTSSKRSLKKPSNVDESSTCSKTIQNDVDVLRDILKEKECIINELRKKSYDDFLKFEEERMQLNHRIEQLENENLQLKQQLKMQ